MKRILRETLLLLAALGYNLLVYNGGRFLARNLPHTDLSTPLDAMIPLVPATILIYLGCYLFWAINYTIGVYSESLLQKRLLAAHFIGETAAFLCFVLLPTTMARPCIAGNSPYDYLLQVTYAVDEANNLFPSIHCFVSWICWIAVRGRPTIPRWYRAFTLLFAGAVCLSTLTVKQHVVFDVAAGILLAEGSYALACRIFHEKASTHKEPA